MPQTPLKAAKHSVIVDELSPLSKRLKVELRDIRDTKKRNKASCDTKSEDVVSLPNKHSTTSALGQKGQKKVNMEEGATKIINPCKKLSSSVFSGEIQSGKKLSVNYKMMNPYDYNFSNGK